MRSVSSLAVRSCLGTALFLGCASLPLGAQEPGEPASAPASAPTAVAALGRLEPDGGIIRLAAPSTPLSLGGSVLARLLVAEGQDVVAGQLIAVTDVEPALQAAVAVAEAELALERKAAEASRSKADEACVIAEVQEREADRRTSLLERDLASQEEVDQSRGDAQAQAASCTAAKANAQVADAAISLGEAVVARRKAELDRAFIKAPFAGRVLRVLAEPGEYVGPEGFLELGRVERMMAIAEVYETDIRRVSLGQTATISSDALDADLTGTVAFIRPKVQKQDEIGTDPAARKDARIIEVGIRLTNASAAANLTNLQVEVVIAP